MNGNTLLIPLHENAIKHTKVNGKKLEGMKGVVLKPNDRICIGPSAIFLFKHRDKESEASMPDTDAEPISFDFASAEAEGADIDENDKF
jgi:hypothetical protein